VKAGAREALEALGSSDDVIQSLLTGNIQANAALKLAAFGLERYPDFEVGAYGSHRGVRADLVGVACERASAKHRVAIEPADAVVIGDTPLDVEAARRGGARAVAVATGSASSDELWGAGPDVVLSDLRDTKAVLEAVCG
jgi:phosphoglycolate phosphatase